MIPETERKLMQRMTLEFCSICVELRDRVLHQGKSSPSPSVEPPPTRTAIMTTTLQYNLIVLGIVVEQKRTTCSVLSAEVS